MGMIADLWAKLSLRPDHGSFEKGHKAIEGIKHGLEAFLGIEAIKKVGEWGKELVDHTTEVGTHAIEAAEKLGITAEAVQELGFAAKQTGVDQGELESGLGKLAKNLDVVAQKGSGPAADALARLGLHAKDFQGLNLDQSFSLISEKLNTIPDGIKKIGISKDLFGKVGQNLIPLTKDLEELRTEAEKTGNVISGEDAESLKEFGKEQRRLGGFIQGLKNQVVIGLLPALRKIVEGIQEWVAENRELIKAAIAQGIQIVIDVFKALGFVIKTIVVPAIQFLLEHKDLLEAFLVGIGVVAAGLGLIFLASFAPILAVVALITGLAYIIIKIVKNWDLIKAKGRQAWEAIKQKARDFLDFLESIPRRILDGFVALGEGIIHALGEAFDWVVHQAKALPGKVWNFIKDIPVVGHIAGALESTVGVAATDPFSQALSAPAMALSEQASGTNITVQTGDINVQAPVGTDPESFGTAIGVHIQKHLDSEYRKAAD